jgi:hypothetical protein
VTLEAFSYLVTNCNNMFLNSRIINVDFLHFHEENLSNLSVNDKGRMTMDDDNIDIKRSNLNKIVFRNPFKIKD